MARALTRVVQALITTYEKVNQDFGSIFTTLLPGARAELRPLEGVLVGWRDLQRQGKVFWMDWRCGSRLGIRGRRASRN